MNLNMLRELPNPDAIKALLPTTPQLDAIKARRDQEIRDILSGKDDKFLLIIGPCSADRQDAVLDYISPPAEDAGTGAGQDLYHPPHLYQQAPHHR